MIIFREMKQDDLNIILNNKDLRSLVTINTHGERVFAFIIEYDKEIIGGVSGSISGNNAFVKCNIITQIDQKSSYKDGLYRALINKLDLEGVEYLFTFEMDPVLKSLGFKMIENRKTDVICNTTINEPIMDKYAYLISIKGFFD